MSLTTDRRFSVHGERTDIDVRIEYQTHHVLKRPLAAIHGWLQRGAVQRESEYQLTLMIQRLASRRPQ
jgi:hypothetical protein